MKRTLITIALLLAGGAAFASEPALVSHDVQRGEPSTTAAAPRAVPGGATIGNGWVSTQDRRDRRRERGVSAILFSNPDLRGDRYVIEGDYMRDLANTGFNDRAQSLRVEQGYWIFCSDADFQGTCRTFGPGDYPRLAPGLDNRVSSGRRISSDYPYRGKPTWNRR